jgi:uncharacterized protein DUF547
MEFTRLKRPRGAAVVALLAIAFMAAPRAQESSGDDARRKNFDQILDLYVRDGEVYYRALKLERAKLDGFVSAIGSESIDKRTREERLAFWLNAYNALVLRTVIDHYPIQGKSADYPAKSIRQVPGAFERLPHRVAGRTLTLDQIEQTILPEFRDPRVYLALGRGAASSGRLRSEAFAPQNIDAQLTEAAAECVTRARCFNLDRATGKISRRRRRSSTEARSNARCSRSCGPNSSPPKRNTWRRTRSRSSTCRSTGRSTTSPGAAAGSRAA